MNYVVTNLAARETLGQAAYNVAPLTTGAYFQKINCFCFTEQRLRPARQREMPVVFYRRSGAGQGRRADDLNTITLSYTFYPRCASRAAAGGGAAERGRRPDTRTRLRENGERNGRRARQATTIIIWSIRARGRSSARSRPSLLAVGADHLDAQDVRRARRWCSPPARSACSTPCSAGGATSSAKREYEGDHTRVVQISHRYGMILFIASEVMFFVAWFWAYFNDGAVSRPTCTMSCAPSCSAASGRRRASRPSIPGTCRCSTR